MNVFASIGQQFLEETNDMTRREKILIMSIMIVFFLAVFGLLTAISMEKDLSHDEHQYIASGKLFSARKLIPYIDYPYFHMPYLAFVYALLFKCTDYLLLTARGFSVICATFMLIVIFFVTFGQFKNEGYLQRVLFGILGVTLILTNPLFLHTTGYAHNHDSSVFLTVLAFVVHCHGMKRDRGEKWLIGSGILLGLAIGIRLSFAPSLVAFVATVMIYPDKILRKRFSLTLCFALGVLIALLPSIILFGFAPKNFIFGNLEYARLNSLFRSTTGYKRAMTFFGKTEYLLTEVISSPGNLLIALAFLYLVVPGRISSLKAMRKTRIEVLFILILLPFLAIGTFAPTPSWYQYFYAPIPFIILSIIYQVSYFSLDGVKRKETFKFCFIILFISFIYAVPKYTQIDEVLKPNGLFPVWAHRIGAKISSVVEGGKILTLSPIYVLEGGLDIYEEFATGPFAWRVAHLLSQERRFNLGMIAEQDLIAYLEKEIPRGILVGMGDGNLEESFVEFAREKMYKSYSLDEGILWHREASERGKQYNPRSEFELKN